MAHRDMELGLAADIFVGVSKHGRTVILDHDELMFRRRKGLEPHAVNLLGMSAIGDNAIDFDAAEIAYVGSPRDIERYMVKAGDILLQCRGTRLNAAMVPASVDSFSINSTVIAIRCKPDVILPRLLLAYFGHPVGQAELLRSAASGAMILNITVRALSQLRVPIPTADQQRFADLLEAAQEFRNTAVEAANKRYAIAQELVIQAMLNGDQSC